MVDVDKVLKNTVKKGKVKIGTKETKHALNEGSAKLVVMANNCPYSSDISALAKKKKTPIYGYKASSIDLGYTCGKSYAVSVFAVIDEGGSSIMHLVKK